MAEHQDHTEPDEATRAADEADAAKGHTPDRAPTDTELAEADKEFAEDDESRRADVARHEKEMLDIGANVKGEGAIE
jgi:hypothetical protein